MHKNFVDLLMEQEMIQKLVDRGFSTLIEALLSHDGKVWTKKGRLNKSGACRKLGCKPKELEMALLKCREILLRETED